MALSVGHQFQLQNMPLSNHRLPQAVSNNAINRPSKGLHGVPLGDPLDSCDKQLESWFWRKNEVRDKDFILASGGILERWLPKGVVRDHWANLSDAVYDCLMEPGAGLYPKGCNVTIRPKLMCYMFRQSGGIPFPGIVITHSHNSVLKNAVAILLHNDRSSRFRHDYQNPWKCRIFTLKEKLTLFSADSVATLSTNQEHVTGQMLNACGMSLDLNASRRATLGGVIGLDGLEDQAIEMINWTRYYPGRTTKGYYGLTVDHVFQEGAAYSDDSDTDDDGDEILNFYDADGESYEIDPQRHQPHMEAANQGQLFEFECRSDKYSHGLHDWALVKSNYFGYDMGDLSDKARRPPGYGRFVLNEISIPPHLRLTTRSSDSVIYPETISDEAPEEEVLVATRRGVIEAYGIDKQFKSFTDVGDPSWVIQARSGSFCYGDSGSWVIDLKSGALCGVLTAGLPSLGMAYLVPAKVIFEDLEKLVATASSVFTPFLPTRDHFLLTAIKSKDFHAVDRILGCSAQNSIGRSVCRRALLEEFLKDYDSANKLLRSGALDTKARDDDGQTVLHVAVRVSSADIVGLVLATANVDVNETDDRKRSALQLAAGRCDPALMKMISETPGVKPEIQDHRGRTPLHMVVDPTADDDILAETIHVSGYPLDEDEMADEVGSVIVWV